MRGRRAIAAAALLVAIATIASALPLTPEPLSRGERQARVAFSGASPADPCPGAAATRRFDVSAIAIPISYDHFGDFDPGGRLFVLAQDEMALRADVAAKLEAAGLDTAARVVADPASAPFTLGYSFPTGTGAAPKLSPFDTSALAQPLIVRAHVGECVVFRVTNKLAEPVGLTVARAIAPPGQGSALGDDAPDLARPGETREFTVYVPDEPGMEGAHFLSSPADPRFQTSHGLFGALVAEPHDAAWLAPDGGPIDSGEAAIVTRPGATDFREYVVMLHDEISLVDRSLNPLPAISPYGEYGPGSKGINLRSEPFMDRFALVDSLASQGVLDRGHDKSQAYGSYANGEGAQFVPQAYVGDPTKFRLVNAGPGQHHVFHLHGGGDRWRVSPLSDDTQMDDGLVKQNPEPVAKSERDDVQLAGPGESFNLEIEGGAGGVQQSAGDFLFHCHIVEHYVAGMWSYWRVFNTLQPGLAELPDRAGRMPGAVDSTQLLGRALPDGTVLSRDNVDAWVRAQLPPQGATASGDATAWDWIWQPTASGPLYLSEPDDTHAWPDYKSATPGQRHAILFDPANGRLAYPLLAPHLNKRPPFAPMHGPAPYLSQNVDARHPDGLCPPGARVLRYDLVALSVPVAYNAHGDVDPDGEVFVLAQDKRDVLLGAKPAQSIVLRADQGDCVDVMLSSQLADPDSKVNVHIHLVQFDVQASDGVITGFNYEQSVRPAAATGAALAAAADAGAGTILVDDASTLRVGSAIGIGLAEPTLEVATIVAVDGNLVTLDHALASAHAAGERAGPEFVHYRWYADAELGIVYFHDHVDGLNSWRHGLFGALVVEPAAAEWRDPRTAEATVTAPVADIIAPSGSFREMVAELQDRSASVGAPPRDLASFGLRSEPFDRRDASSPLAGDAATATLRAYPGDPLVVRLLYGANANTRAVGTFALDGHRFPVEQHDPGSRTVDRLSLGISAQQNLRVECGAGGCARLPGDYLYRMTQPDLFRRGAWGIVRVEAAPRADLETLPGHEAWTAGSLPDAPTRRYDITALRANVTVDPAHGSVQARDVFALSSDVAAIRAGTLDPAPLVLRASPGERVLVTLANELDRPVSLHAGLVEAADRGIDVGAERDQTVAPGATRAYAWLADKELGIVPLESLAAPADDALAGLYGALVVEPAGATFDPATGLDANVTLASGDVAREHVLIYASDDPGFEASVMPYTSDVRGVVSVDYRTAPLADRVGGRHAVPGFTDPVGGLGVDSCEMNNDSCAASGPAGAVPRAQHVQARSPAASYAPSAAIGGPLSTPVLDAPAHGLLVLRALNGAGDQLAVHALAGHAWKRDPDMPGSEIVSAVTLGAGEASNAWIEDAGAPGDYLYGNARGPFYEAGAWGVLRVS